MYRRTPEAVGQLMNRLAMHDGSLCVLACGDGDLIAPIAHENTDISSIHLVDMDVKRLKKATQLLDKYPNQVSFESKNVFDLPSSIQANRVLVHAPHKARWGRHHKDIMRVDGLSHYVNMIEMQLLEAAPTPAFLWLMASLYHTAEEDGLAVVLVDNSLMPNNSADQAIQQWLVENRRIEAIIRLPAYLMDAGHSAIWILSKESKWDNDPENYRILFVDGSRLGRLEWEKRKPDGLIPHRAFDSLDWQPIKMAYGSFLCGHYEECKSDGLSISVSIQEIREKDYMLYPSFYVWNQEDSYDSSVVAAYHRALKYRNNQPQETCHQ